MGLCEHIVPSIPDGLVQKHVGHAASGAARAILKPQASPCGKNFDGSQMDADVYFIGYVVYIYIYIFIDKSTAFVNNCVELSCTYIYLERIVMDLSN